MRYVQSVVASLTLLGCSSTASTQPEQQQVHASSEWAALEQVEVETEPCMILGTAPTLDVSLEADRATFSVDGVAISSKNVCAASLRRDDALKVVFAPCPADQRGFYAGCFNVRGSTLVTPETRRIEIWKIAGWNEAGQLDEPQLVLTEGI